MGRRSVAIVFGAVALAACNAITGVGELSADSGASSPTTTTPTGEEASTTGDAGSPLGQVDATVVDGCSAASCALLPDGFQLVAFGSKSLPMGSDACPSGFAQPFDGVEVTSIDPGACSCGCQPADKPSCVLAAGNTIGLSFGPPGSAMCNAMGQSVLSGCSTDGFLGPFIAYDRNYSAPAATLTGGTCTTNTAKDDSNLKTLGVRVCQATVIPQCEGKTCPPDVAPLFTACIAKAGDVKCPESWPTHHLVGSAASLACNGASCGCNVSGQCSTSGTLSYFASTNCSGGAALTYPVGSCTQTGGSNGPLGSHRYDPNPPTNVRCNATGTSAATTTLTQETTVCCL